MASIDERIVAMSFENSRFEAGVATTMATLHKLDRTIADIGKVNGLGTLEAESHKVTLTAPMEALQKLKSRFSSFNAGQVFADIEKSSNKVELRGPTSALSKLRSALFRTNAGTTFSDMENAANRVNFGGLERSLDGIQNHFSMLKGAATVAMGNIAAQAAMRGAAIVKSFALQPIIDGFHNYETQINAIQTIQANTGLSGSRGMGQITSALANLNKYANQTVYNFSEMVQNIGTFTAAGVKLGPAVDSIKGIANLAAMSGSNSQQASEAMYQLSQAISAGRVQLQDWNSVVNAGIGGKVFQDALVRTGVAMGTIKKSAVEVNKATGQATINGQSFRNSISATGKGTSWLTSGVLVKTLQQFTGDLSDAQLKAEGFSAAQIKMIQSQARTAVNAATQIKTASQLVQALKEEVGTAWAAVFKTLFGNIGAATTLFSGLHTFMENALTNPVYRFNQVLQDWSRLGGRANLIEGLKRAFADLQAVLKPIREAFREIFPAQTGQQLADLTLKFAELMNHLRISTTTAENLRRTFAGVFAIIHIGWTLVKDLVRVFFDLIGGTGKAAGGILNFTGGLGDFLVHLDKVISKGNGVIDFFHGLETAIKFPIDVLKGLASAIGGLFGGVHIGGFGGFGKDISQIGQSVAWATPVVKGAIKIWDEFVHILARIKDAVSPFLSDVAGVFSKFGGQLGGALSHLNFDKVFKIVQTGILGGILLSIKKALGINFKIDFGLALFKDINTTFKNLTNTLTQMQKALHAAVLVEIAVAIGVLAGSLLILSRIDPRKLASALTATALGLGELVAAMAVLNKVGGSKFSALSLIGVAAALTLLAASAKVFSTMNWNGIAKGIVGIAGSLIAVSDATQLMNGPKLLVTAAALIPLATGLNILAVAVHIFSTVSWNGLIKGLIGVGGSLTAIAIGMKLMPLNLVITGSGLMAIATSLTVLAAAVAAFGFLSFNTIMKGIAGLGTALVVLGEAIDAIPLTAAIQGAGLIVVSAGLTSLAVAIALFGHFNLITLGKGLFAIGASLGILALGLTLMGGTLPGSLALLAAAGAFAILTPTLAVLGIMPWGVLLKGLGALAATLGVLGVMGLIAAPALLALGVGIGVLGIGLAAVGAAVYLFAKGVNLLTTQAVNGFSHLLVALGAFIVVFPNMVINFVKGIVDILGTLVTLAPKIVDAIIKILLDVLKAIPRLIPGLVVAIGSLVTAMIRVFDDDAERIFEAGLRLLVRFLAGIANNIGRVVREGVRLVVNFVNAIASNAPRLVGAGTNLIIRFIAGVTSQIPRIVGSVTRLISTFLLAVARNVGRVIAAGGSLIVSFLNAIAREVPRIYTAGVNIILGFLRGVSNAIPRIVNTAINVAATFINAVASGLLRLVNVGYNAIVNFLNGLANAIRRNSQRLYDAGWNLASAIIQGMVNGLGSLAGHLWNMVQSLASKAVHYMTHPWEIGSPSKLTARLGMFIMQGFIVGLSQHAPSANAAMESTANNIVKTASDAFSKLPSALGDMMPTQPVITPVLDLSEVRKHANTIKDIMPAPVLTPSASTAHAAAISTATHKATAQATAEAVKDTTPSISLTQNNYSPDPLPAIEIYRQTNNQMAKLKALVGAK